MIPIKTFPTENSSDTVIKPYWVKHSFIFRADSGLEFDMKITTRKSYTQNIIVTRMVKGIAKETERGILFEHNAFYGKIITMSEEPAKPVPAKPRAKTASAAKGPYKHGEVIKEQIELQHAKAIEKIRDIGLRHYCG